MKNALIIGVFLFVSAGLFSTELWNGISTDMGEADLLRFYPGASVSNDVFEKSISIKNIMWNGILFNVTFQLSLSGKVSAVCLWVMDQAKEMEDFQTYVLLAKIYQSPGESDHETHSISWEIGGAKIRYDIFPGCQVIFKT